MKRAIVITLVAVTCIFAAGWSGVLGYPQQNDTLHDSTGHIGDSAQTAPHSMPVSEHTEPAPEKAAAHAETTEHGGHPQSVAIPVLFALIVILITAKLGGDVLERFRQPAVLGELVIGVIIGNLTLFNFHGLDFLKTNASLEVLAEIGVIILLFEVGLETKIRDMLSVGTTAFAVASLGVIAPFFLGWGVAVYFLPDESIYTHVFVGATLCATSVGITARVLSDIGKVKSKEGQIILGAAVIDDIMGLVVLSVVTGLISAAASGNDGGVGSGTILLVVGKAVAFILGALFIGSLLVPHIFRFSLRVKGKGVLLSLALAICFLLAWLAEQIGLAAIVGAFAAGLLMDEVHFKGYSDRGEHHLEDLIKPISLFLVPIFFVRMGLLVDLRTFSDPSILGFAGVLTIAAIIGKQACSLGVWKKGTNKLAIGLGMIPRGEVGLIFAKIGAGLTLAGVAIVSASTYSAVVIMVIVTTLVTPPLLKVSLLRKKKGEE
ncbi:MAG: cation:proton antiporter [Candidatus Zixiibacteriota bacterium]